MSDQSSGTKVVLEGMEFDLKKDLIPLYPMLNREELLESLTKATVAMDALLRALSESFEQIKALEEALDAHRRGEARWFDGRNNEEKTDGS